MCPAFDGIQPHDRANSVWKEGHKSTTAHSDLTAAIIFDGGLHQGQDAKGPLCTVGHFVFPFTLHNVSSTREPTHPLSKSVPLS